MEPDLAQIQRAKEVGADRVELYTESYARAYGTNRERAVLELFTRAADKAHDVGLGVNAGHDLNLENLGLLCGTISNLAEVSIGHALISHALDVGLEQAVCEYLSVLPPSVPLGRV
jgi:pyridoxine 5-phosphate synthase